MTSAGDCISFIIPTTKRNAEDIATLRSLVAYKLLNPNVEVIVSVDRWGSAARARDEGARRSSCDILVFVDDDIEFNSRILDHLISLVGRGYVVMLGGITLEGIPIALSRLTVTRRDAYVSSGGFDGRIILNYHEDIDFAVSCIAKGYKITLIPSGVVKHLEPPAKPKLHRLLRVRILNSFNRAMTLLKNPGIFLHTFTKYDRYRGLLKAMYVAWILLMPPLTHRVRSSREGKMLALMVPIEIIARLSGLLYYSTILLLSSISPLKLRKDQPKA